MNRIAAALPLLALATVACGGVREQIHARPAPASTTFDPAELVDVLPPDRIPAIEQPTFESPAKAGEWLGGDEPVVALSIAGDSRAYPLAILAWHELVDDTVGGAPVVVTYAPLANAAVVFDRRVRRRTETFGVSGKLYRSDLVMFDRATSSLWPQLLAGAVAGPSKGAKLEIVPSQISSLAEFKAAYPGGLVLARPDASGRNYDFNPYAGYDSRTQPFGGFYALRPDARLPQMARVVGIYGQSGLIAVPFARLRTGGVVYPEPGVVVFWRPGTRSSLDAVRLGDGLPVGETGAFVDLYPDRIIGQHLEFTAVPGGFQDRQTGSTWNIFGIATAGPLKGAQLDPLSHVDTFWFAWAAFEPSTTIAAA